MNKHSKAAMTIIDDKIVLARSRGSEREREKGGDERPRGKERERKREKTYA